MPELPEVETVRSTLSTLIIGKTIESIIVRYSKMIQPDTPESFTNQLSNQTFEQIERYGKYLFFHFQSVTLVSHLRMEGKYFIRPKTDPFFPHEHIIFNFSDGQSLRYHDTRKFGTMTLVQKNHQFDLPSVKKLGPEPTSNRLTAAYLYAKAHPSIRPVKSFLLDQTVIAGLGNIYVDEVLFLSRLHPKTTVNHLSLNDCQAIVDACHSVIARAIELGGSTIRSYLSSLGVTGRFQTELNIHMREHEPCYQCQTLIEKIKVGGRGSYFCPQCQKEKREP